MKLTRNHYQTLNTTKNYVDVKEFDNYAMAAIQGVLFDLSVSTKFGALYGTHISKYDTVY